MEMEELLFYQHLHMNPPPSPSSASGQEAFYYDYPPFASAITETRDHVVPIPPPPPRRKVAVMARKDRHSKICTAGGMRDRRMRLSFDVARRFFALQDKLGFDRASMTLQWLLDVSTGAINDILTTSTTSMSLSEEDGSGSVLVARKRAPAPRKSNKESRARARERARERTKERNRLRSSVSIGKEALVPARQVIPVPAVTCSSSFEHGRGSYYNEQEPWGSYYNEQEPWELGEVIFAKSRFH